MCDFSIEYILNRAGDRYIGTNASVGIFQRLQRVSQLPFHQHHPHHQHQHQHHPYARPAKHEDGHISSPNRVPASADPPSALLEDGQLPIMYDWLQYTRYHPPKLPRAMRIGGPAKRTPGRLPRIPFTPAQLQALESAYKESNYLSAEDANKLAESLDLTNTRVKIWFQNRRARERREKREKDESCDSTFSSNASSPEPEMIVIV